MLYANFLSSKAILAIALIVLSTLAYTKEYTEEELKQMPLKAVTEVCKSKNGLACLSIAQTFFDKENYKQTREYAEKACNLNEGSGCTLLGFLYNNGKGVKQDYKKTKELLEKACGLNNGRGCSNLGVSYEMGHGVRQDFKKARELYEKSCYLNDWEGCNNLGLLYENGLGVRQDLSLAKEYYGKTCDLGEQVGCDMYARLNSQGY